MPPPLLPPGPCAALQGVFCSCFEMPRFLSRRLPWTVVSGLLCALAPFEPNTGARVRVAPTLADFTQAADPPPGCPPLLLAPHLSVPCPSLSPCFCPHPGWQPRLLLSQKLVRPWPRCRNSRLPPSLWRGRDGRQTSNRSPAAVCCGVDAVVQAEQRWRLEREWWRSLVLRACHRLFGTFPGSSCSPHEGTGGGERSSFRQERMFVNSPGLNFGETPCWGRC